jgi:hypothetical protein
MTVGNFQPMSGQELQAIATKLEGLTKSFAAGFPGLSNAGRTQTSAVAIDNLEPTLRSIALEEEDFLLIKDIQQMPAKSSVYQYVMKTAVRGGVDLWGVENFLPQEDHAKYMRVAEVLKVQGIRKTITHMAQLINEVGGYMVDLEAENDQNAAMAMSESLERALYSGGDYYMDSTGEIDATIAANPNGPVRQIRGIQAQIREGNYSARGIPGDFVGYGNNQTTLADARGATLSREFVDKICVAVRNNRGKIEEAHCTTNQLQSFRSTFFPFERGDMGAWYAPKGAGVDIEPKSGFNLKTVTGDVNFIPSVFKFSRIYVEPVYGSVGSAPSTPTITSTTPTAGTTNFKNGDVFVYTVQAWNVNGASMGSSTSTATLTADGQYVPVVIAAQSGVEEFWVFRTDATGVGVPKFVGRVVAARAGATTFVDTGKILPGFDSVVFFPKKSNRAKLAVLSNLLTKMKLGRTGLVEEIVYVSYLACILEFPRHHALAMNVYQELDL